jgi:hypothetical protein
LPRSVKVNSRRPKRYPINPIIPGEGRAICGVARNRLKRSPSWLKWKAAVSDYWMKIGVIAAILAAVFSHAALIR